MQSQLKIYVYIYIYKCMQYRKLTLKKTCLKMIIHGMVENDNR